MELTSAPMALHEAIRHAVEICRGEIQARNQRLTVTLAARHDHLEGDFRRIQQVVWNLLKNASKFTPEGGKIRLRTKNEPGRFILQVTDTGIGLEPSA